MMILAATSSCCCYENEVGYLFHLLLQRLLLLLLVPGWENTMAVKDGEAPNRTPKIPNVTSETHRKS